MKHRRFTALLFVPLLALITACGANQSAQTTEAQSQQQTNTHSQQDKSGSDSAKTTVADPTQGNWTETYSSPTDLGGELDKAWLKCAPQNNPDPEAFAWKTLHRSQQSMAARHRRANGWRNTTLMHGR